MRAKNRDKGKEIVKDGEFRHELLADTLLREYVERLERENRELLEQLKARKQPEFHNKITKKGRMI